jgi:hypothetical protein
MGYKRVPAFEHLKKLKIDLQELLELESKYEEIEWKFK